jgi:hypothetical protein
MYDYEKNRRDKIIDLLIVTSEEFHRNIEDYESDVDDYKRYIVDSVCVYLKQCESISDIQMGMKPLFMFDS